jgi:MFS family permease
LPTSVFADTAGRKRSLMISVVCNLISALSIVFFPTYRGFIVASFFGGLYFAFWSGTGQAFLEDNLRHV